MAKANSKEPKDPRVVALEDEIRELQSTLGKGAIALIVIISICYMAIKNGSEYNMVVGFFVGGVILMAIVGGVAGANRIGDKHKEIERLTEISDKKSPT